MLPTSKTGIPGYGREAVLSILRDAARAEATEVHFKVPLQPMLRVGGDLRPLSRDPVTARDTMDILLALAGAADLEIVLAGTRDFEFSFGLQGVGRFRVLAFRQRGSFAIVVQRLAIAAPTLIGLGFGLEASHVLNTPGLTLLVGPQRHQLLHALVGAYNVSHRGHLVLLESPIMYLHRDDRAAITHREVGQDVVDFSTGLRQAVRSGADQIVLGDIPDIQTAEAMLTAAELDHCVIAAVAAPGEAEARQAITRLFSGENRPDVHLRLGRVLRHLLRFPAAPAAS